METKKILYKIMIIFIIVSLLLPLSTNYIVRAVTTLTLDDCPYDIEFTKISTSIHLSMGIDSNGYLWGWGLSSQEVFGEAGVTGSVAPRKISETLQFKDVAVYDDHILAIDKQNNLYAWGDNSDGQLGIGGTTDSVSLRIVKSGTKFSQIAVSRDVSMAIDTSGNLWAWGSYTGRLGLGNITENVLEPQKVSESIKFSKISIGGIHSLALDTAGNLYSWGNNLKGQLGNGTTSGEVQVPTQILTGKTFKEIAAGTEYSLAIDTSGNIWSWGANYNGQLGDGTKIDSGTPKQITTGKVFNKIEAGTGGLVMEGSSFAIDSEGKLWSWGKNQYYWLGNGTNQDTVEPTKVMENITFKDISAGQFYAIGIDASGESWSWGHYASNAKGTGTEAPYNKPIRFTGDDYVVTFKDGTNTLKTENVKFNKSATAPTPTKEGYTLSWDKEFNKVMEDITVTAVWTKVEEVGYTVEHYKQNLTGTYDKVEADTEHLTGAPGGTATAVAKPYVGYHENTSHGNRVASGTILANGSLVLKLYYDLNEYTVTFKDGDTVLSSQKVKYGATATAPTPTKEGHTFVNWDKTFTNVTSDLTVNANWRVNTYEVTLNTNGGAIAQGSELTSYTYGIGATLPIPTKTGYIFAGWYNNEDFTGETIANIGTKATGDRQYFAKWTQNQLTVTFKDGNTVLKTQNVGYGESATAPIQTKDGYVLRWDKQFNNITTDLTVNAVWLVDTDKDGIPDIEDNDTKVAYTVKHYKQVGNTNEYRLEETQSLTGQLGANVTAVAKSYAGYVENTTTSQRIPNGTVVANGSLELRLFYDTIKYTVTFVIDGQTEKTETVAHGGAATAPAQTKDGYVLRWDKQFSNVTSDLTVNAVWLVDTDKDGIPDIEDNDTKVAYTVEHYKQVGNTNEYKLEETETLMGQLGANVTAVEKGYESHTVNKQIEGTVASGVVTVDGSLVLKLYYDINKYTVIFKDGDQIVKTQTVIYGENATPPTLTKPGYILSWDKKTDNITGNETLVAVWTKDPNYVDPNDGKEETPSKLPQTGENYMIIGTMSVLISAAIFVYLKYNKID